MENTADLSKENEKIAKKYLGNEYEEKISERPVYILNDISTDEKQELASEIAGPLMEMSTITNEETEKQIKEKMTVGLNDYQKSIIENQELIDILKNMPQEQREQMLAQFTEKVTSLPDSIKEQGAVSSVKEIYNKLGVDTDKLQNDYIFMTGLEMLGIALVSMISAVVIMLFSSRVAAKLGKTLRDKVFKKVIGYSNKELNQFSTASLITRSTNDIQQIQQLITLFLLFL